MSLLGDTWTAFGDNEGWQRVTDHVHLSVVALGIATAIGVAMGIASARGGPIGSFVISACAFVGRMVPTFAAMALVMALSSIGFWPAVTGLTILGIPPILLNVATGLRGADPGAVEAARGMGMTSGQTLTRVEVPLALPFLFTGMRTASVMIIATAALAGAIGAGGLGVTIVAGFANGQDDVLLAGAIPVTLLALAGELLFLGAERTVTPTGLRRARRQARISGRNA